MVEGVATMDMREREGRRKKGMKEMGGGGEGVEAQVASPSH
jgi:hypothetical protein